MTKHFTPEVMARAIRFMRTNRDWELFYLGIQPEITHFTTKKMEEGIINVHSLTTHAYVVHRRFMERVIQIPFMGLPIDMLFVFNDHAYASYPGLFYQGDFGTDIGENGGSDPFRTLKYRTQEAYAANINLPLRLYVGSLLVLIVGIILIVVIRPANIVAWLLVVLAIAIVVLLWKSYPDYGYR